MAKTKYRFNPDTLVYEEYKPHFWENFIKIGGYLSTIAVLSIAVGMLLFFVFDSPREKELERELERYEMKLEVINNEMDQLNQLANNLESRDKKIYRAIFEAEPIPENIRKAGYGGVNYYSDAEKFSNPELIKETQKRLDKLTKEYKVLSQSYKEITQLASKKQEMLGAIPSIQPIKNEELNRIASGYGKRIHPIYKTKRFHEGIDFTASKGASVFATGNGKVIKTEYSRRGYGNQVIIDHGYGYKTMYAHLKDFEVEQGEKVKRGQKIGSIGNTGLSTGPHLHYEVRKKGKKINPINFFHNDLDPEEYEKVVKLANRANQSLD